MLRLGLGLDRLVVRARFAGQADSITSASGTMTLFVPSDLPGLLAWYRADLGIHRTGVNVTGWDDQSGAGDTNRNLTAPGTNPTFTASDSAYNNQPTLQFTNNSPLRSGIWSSARTQPVTIFCAANGTGNYILDARTDTGTSQQALFQASSNPAMFAGAAIAIGNGTPITAPSILVAVFHGVTSRGYQNSRSVTNTGSSGSNNCDGITVGDYAGGSTFGLSGSIAEIVVCSGDLSTADIDRWVSYASARYGIAIA